MKVKRMVKRILALGTGATMLGATMMGALAADLSDYPTPWVTDGVLNGKIVVGEAAKAIDTIVATDVATNMWYSTTAATVTTVAGDAWKVGTSTEFFELSHTPTSGVVVTTGQTNAGGEIIRNITDFIDEDELSALADGTYATAESTVDTEQTMYFDNERSGAVFYDENEQDVTADFLVIASGDNIARYMIEFSPGAESDIDGTTLEDYEQTQMTFMGQEYTIVSATMSGGGSTLIGAKLTMMAGAAGGTLTEGVPETYDVSGKDYTVEVIWMDDDEVKFDVNGQTTNKLKKGGTYTLADGTIIGVSDVLYSGKTGVDSKTTFWLGANKVIIEDNHVSSGVINETGAQSLLVASETIEDCKTSIFGSNTSSKFTIDSIMVNMSADDDFYVGVGEKLSENPELAEPQVLFSENWDIEYHGLSDVPTHEIKLRARSTSRYDIRFTDGDGNVVDLPFVYTSSGTTLKVGDASDRDTVLTEAARFHDLADGSAGGNENNYATGGNESNSSGFNITKNDYFVITDSTQSAGSRKSWALQYKGVDAISDSSPQIRFKNLATGETIERTWKNNTGATADATLTMGGKTFNVFSIEGLGSGLLSQLGGIKDEQIWIDLDGSGNTQPVANNTYIADKYGAELRFYVSRGAVGGGLGGQPADTGLGQGNTSRNWTTVNTAGFGIHINITTPDSDDYDDVQPSPQFGFNVSASGGEVATSSPGGVTFKTPEGVDDYSYAYNSMGAFITNYAPSNDPREITIDYPESQRLPQVYFTSGSTATTKSAGGSLGLVTVPVGATVFDTEVSDIEAQNAIVVGGPCVNTAAAELLGNPADCTEGFTPGVARIKLFEHANGNVALLVAGYAGQDTRLAGRILADYQSRALSGVELEVEGNTLQDATVRRVSVE